MLTVIVSMTKHQDLIGMGPTYYIFLEDTPHAIRSYNSVPQRRLALSKATEVVLLLG